MNAQRIEKLRYRIQEARARLLKAFPEFAQPLRELIYVATKDVNHISTNGTCIYFDPDWLQKLEDASLDFILAHQLGHIQLRHFERPTYYHGDRFHLAADIVVNARLRKMGWRFEKLPGIGNIYYETFFPRWDGADLTAEEAMDGVPFDPSSLPEGKRRKYMIDSDRWWDASSDRGENGVVILRPDDPDPFDLSAGNVSFGNKRRKKKPDELLFQPMVEVAVDKQCVTVEKPQPQKQSWERTSAPSIQKLRTIKQEQRQTGEQDGFKERLWQKPNQPGLDWKTLLNSFIREDIYDYSFAPPDRRYQEDSLFLPDFNVPVERIKDVLFMVDTSASVTDRMLSTVYREISFALEQFDGGLSGVIGFFDTQVRKVCPFQQVEDLRSVVPVGGGGTNYDCVFAYCETLRENPPCCIVIFTDGEADFPSITVTQDIPVLWLFTKETASAQWGQFAYVPNHPQ